ncbi:MAG: family carbohydrate transporter rane protein 1 [Firmicutes bacterium]|nr:family carbohydrate transporter rane protein 1 [Bacillota bacterium]
MATVPQPVRGAPRPTRPGLTLAQKRTLWAWGALAVPLLFFLVVRILPTLVALNMSFRQWDMLSPDKPWVGMANYQKLFKDPVFVRSLTNTFLYVVVGVPVQLILGLGVALLIQRVNRFAGLFRTLYFIPYITSAVAVAWVWRWMLQEHGGIFNELLHLVGIAPQKFLGSPTQALYSIVAAIVWQGLGFQMVIFLAGLEAIPTMFYEAAQLDGASPWQVFRHITLPLLNPTIVFSAIIGTIRYLQVFTEVLSMSNQGQGGPLNSTKTLVLFIYQEAFKSSKYGYAAAATVVLFLIILVLTVVQNKLITRKYEY